MMKKLSLTLLLAAAFMLLIPGLKARADASGTCGENVSWVLEDGTLTISGSGEMNDYSTSFYRYSPWTNYADVIKHVVIEAGVTSIGEHAFYALANVETVVIPTEVNKIGRGAFHSCQNLKEITIPDAVTSIEDYTFTVCSSLEAIDLSSKLTDIGAYAFNGCTNLTTITFPSTLTSVRQ